ncbi:MULTISPECIES: 50S ribosomal protein L29 [Weeksella]|uniref:50S ribosomal protein L29 n=1 Tax=Weeksella TaxID=1013 RepID=UPI0008A5004A|nr:MULTISPECIES: 50S ribosomal protein L29 [Weeksella]OFM83873.1 50S ribosomal protein L29 [Weeksella sp. HMSC059D05]SUP54393.1 50S ribosomal protein L29 [Weeksella virosa]
MKTEEIRNLSIEDLNAKIAEEQKALEQLEMTHAISPIANPIEIRNARKLVARLKTILTEKQKQQ